MATLSFNGKDWLGWTAFLLVVALLVLIWGYRRFSADQRWKGVCLTLKIAGFIALLFILLEPVWNREQAQIQANYFAIVADNSQGMKITDAGDSASRGEHLKHLLTGEDENWQQTISDVFRARRYKVDSRVTPIEDFGELDFSGNASSLIGGLESLGERYQNRPLAGILLFTDGNATDAAKGLENLKNLPPVYPVITGRKEAVQDIAIQKVSVTETAFEDAPVSVQADVVATGFVGDAVHLEVFDPDGARVERQEQEVQNDGGVMAFRFQVKPERIGVNFYRIEVSADSRGLRPSDASREATLANNRRSITVKRRSTPYRILYVAGRPNWEYKYLNRALSEDDQVRLVGLIRIAEREPKFEFKGRRGESSNPLYRGFGQETEETEQYDQAVLKRLNVQDEFELKGGFPKVAEDLYRYHAVLLSKVEAGFFTRDQMMLLQKFVSERGGGVMMMGGMESFREGDYYRTPIGDMLPVYLDQEPEQEVRDDLKLALSREGWLQPWARLRPNELEERQRLDTTLPFKVFNPVRGIKPGASVIAEVEDQAGNRFPGLVTQRFGNGRTAALMVGDMWRWGLRDPEYMKDLYKSWRQLVRWLVSDVPERVDLQIDAPEADEDATVKLHVRVRDQEFKPLDNASVKLRVEPVGEEAEGSDEDAIELTAEPSSTEAGLYESRFISRNAQGYRASVLATDDQGKEVGRAESGWFADPAAEEFRSLTPNFSLMESLAKTTGGEVISSNDLEAFAKDLPTRKMPVMEIHSSPIWNTPLLFLIALLCFLGEWGLRRWKGMP